MPVHLDARDLARFSPAARAAIEAALPDETPRPKRAPSRRPASRTAAARPTTATVRPSDMDLARRLHAAIRAVAAAKDVQAQHAAVLALIREATAVGLALAKR